MTTAVIQARMGSTRLPGKVLAVLGDRPVLGWVVRAADEAEGVDAVVVATTTDPSDDAVEAVANDLGATVVRGHPTDVLARFIAVLDALGGDPIVRLTADCPLLDPTVIAATVSAFHASAPDYLSTITPRTLPRGLDVEVVSAAALRRADEYATGADRAHVTSWLYREPDRAVVEGLTFDPPAPDFRVTVDTPEDLEAVRAIVAELGDRPPGWREVVDLLASRPDIVAINAHVGQKPLDAG